MAEPAQAQQEPEQPGPFERDTAVSEVAADGEHREFAAVVGEDWRAGRGPHGGYLAAMVLRALTAAVDDPGRAPRSLTIHYARAPKTGPVRIHTTVERRGRSLSTLSARMEQDGTLVALAVSAFSVPWPGPELSDISMPAVAPPDDRQHAASGLPFDGPPFHGNLVLQPRIDDDARIDGRRRMEFAAWVGLLEARPLDAPALAFLSDALIPAPFVALEEPAPAPTIDLTIHFRVALPRRQPPDLHEMCFARVRAGVVHEGFFEEDEVIWATDGTVLAQSRQLALLIEPTRSQ